MASIGADVVFNHDEIDCMVVLFPSLVLGLNTAVSELVFAQIDVMLSLAKAG